MIRLTILFITMAHPIITLFPWVPPFVPHIIPPRYTTNVVYKIISKVIASILKPLLPTLVSEEQTGYVEGRQILNKIIQAYEVVHSLKSNKQVGMIIQLNLAKYYDKLS